MKKIFSFIVLLAGVAMFTSCGDDDATYQATPKLEIASADLAFEAAGGTGTVTVNNPAGTLTATTESSWLAVAVNGSTVTITAERNRTLEGRSATILLKAGDTENTITATQKGSEYGLSGLNFTIADVANSSVNVDIVHTEGVTVSTETSWLQAVYDAASDQIVITATESNDADEERVGSVTVVSGIIEEEITVVQRGLLLELEKNEATAANAASDVAIAVEHSRDLTVTSECDWITAAFDESASAINLTIAENATGDPRIGHVTVTSGPATRDLMITQYEFTSTVESLYMLVYYDATNQDWFYYTAQIANGKLSFLYPATATVTLQYDIPLEINAEDETLAAGPCSSFIGKYGANYWIYLAFRSATGYWTGYTNTTSMAEGNISIVEEDGETNTYVVWGGTFGEQTIDGWGLRAMKAEGFNAENNAGYLTTLYYPYMIRLSNAASSRRTLKGQIESRGHIIKPAPVKTGFEN
jgi:hypothetical protein